jgi:hypothetical protein
MDNQENKLRVKLSTFKSDLSFNEWVEKYNVGRYYNEPTKYFQGNPTSGIEPLKLQRVGNSFLNLFFKS